MKQPTKPVKSILNKKPSTGNKLISKQDNREIKEKDIERIITILGTADGGCSCCVSSLIEQFVEEFSIDKTIASKIISKVSKKEDWYWADSLKSRFDWFKI